MEFLAGLRSFFAVQRSCFSMLRGGWGKHVGALPPHPLDGGRECVFHILLPSADVHF